VAPGHPGDTGGKKAFVEEGIAVDRVVHTPPQSLDDCRRDGKIHIRHPHGQLILLGEVPLEAAGIPTLEELIE
jgi:hypothetical protein